MEKQYILTERTHLMCPNMYFGIVFDGDGAYDLQKVKDVLKVLSEAHPFLRSLIKEERETGRYVYEVGETSKIRLIEGKNANEYREEYQNLSKRVWDVTREGLLQVYAYPLEEGMRILMVAHHLLTDGRGLLALCEEFANCYEEGIEPPEAEERLIQGIGELPEGSALRGISKMLVKRANKQWLKEKHKLDYDQYLEFEKRYQKANPVTYREYLIDSCKLNQIHEECKVNDVTMNDYLMAQMYQRTGTKKIIIAADIREDYSEYRKDSLGNYSTAIGIIVKVKNESVMENARVVHKAVQKKLADNRSKMLVLSCYLDMIPELIDAAPIAARGEYVSKAASFVGKGMFGMEQAMGYSITNLGRCDNPNLLNAMFIPPASPAAKMTAGVLTCGGVMRICTSEYNNSLSK